MIDNKFPLKYLAFPRILLLICLSFISIISTYADKKRYVSALISTVYDPTIRKEVKLELQIGIFNENQIDALSHIDNITIIDGQETKVLKETDITYLEFKDFNGKKRVFVNEINTHFENAELNLLEELFTGKISWYREFEATYIKNLTNAITGEYLRQDITLKSTDWLVKKEDGYELAKHKLDKESLKYMMRDRPDLHDRIETFQTDEQFYFILKDYNLGLEASIERIQKNSVEYQIEQLELQTEIDTIPLNSVDQLKKGDYVLYKGRTGNKIASFVKKDTYSLIVIQYYLRKGIPRQAIVPLKDVLKINVTP